MRWPCCAATTPDGCSSTVLQPASSKAGRRHSPRLGTADHSKVTPGEIAIGVIIGRASAYFDFFVYGIASVLVFPAVFFPYARPLEGTLYAFTIFAFAFVARPIGSIAFMAIQ